MGRARGRPVGPGPPLSRDIIVIFEILSSVRAGPLSSLQRGRGGGGGREGGSQAGRHSYHCHDVRSHGNV